MIEIHNEQGTYSAKMGADSFAEKTHIICTKWDFSKYTVTA